MILSASARTASFQLEGSSFAACGVSEPAEHPRMRQRIAAFSRGEGRRDGRISLRDSPFNFARFHLSTFAELPFSTAPKPRFLKENLLPEADCAESAGAVAWPRRWPDHPQGNCRRYSLHRSFLPRTSKSAREKAGRGNLFISGLRNSWRIHIAFVRASLGHRAQHIVREEELAVARHEHDLHLVR